MPENFIVGMYKGKCWRNSYRSFTRVQITYDIAKCHGCSFGCEILCLFAAYNLALVDSSVFLIFVVIMQLNTKSSLIATKQLVYFLSRKVLTTCSIECFSELCTYTIFWPSRISWCIATCRIEGWWWYTNLIQYKCNRCTVQELSSDASLFSAHLQ